MVLADDWRNHNLYQSTQWDHEPLVVRARWCRSRNLLRNGGFEEWQWDPPQPVGGTASGSSYYTIACETLDVKQGRYAVRQTWHKSDGNAAWPDVFRMNLGRLKPDTTYEAYVSAKSDTPKTVALQAFGIQDGEWIWLPGANYNVQRFKPTKDWQIYGGMFATPPGNSLDVVLAVLLTDEVQNEYSVLWDDWIVAESRDQYAP
jgi:hypothetical protein